MSDAVAQDAYFQTSLGEIARNLPGATAVFSRHRLDFCCGGTALLADAATKRGIDPAVVVDELRRLDPAAAPRDLPETPAGLTAHIIARYHDAHRAELPELIRLAAKVERVHADHQAVPRGLQAHLEAMHEELCAHMDKEEHILFPMMANPGAPVWQPIARMRAEHDEHGQELRRLMELTSDLALPEGACNTWRALYLGLRKFADDLVEHIHTENNILFPAFEPR